MAVVIIKKMRFTIKTKPRPNIGDRKYKTFFAFFPIKIKNEIRWFETVSICYEYYCIQEDWRKEPKYFWKKKWFTN